MTLLVGDFQCGLAISLGTLMIAVGGCNDRPTELAAAPDSPGAEDYGRMCGAALTAAKEFSRRLRTSSAVDAEAVIVSEGPPVRIQCRIRTRNGAPGTVTADIRCMDAFDRKCVGPVTARVAGMIVQGPGRGPTT